MTTDQGVNDRAAYLGPVRRRPLVLDAACEVFAEAGFEGASMREIARRAGVTKPVLYSCFPDGKQEIILALLDREEARILDHLQGVLSVTRKIAVPDGVQLGIRAFFDYAEINPAGFRLLINSPVTADPEVALRTERVLERIIQLMGRRAYELAESIEAPPVVGEIFTRSIVGLVFTMAKWWARDKPVDREVLVSYLTELLMRGLSGMVPPEVLGRGLLDES